MDGRGSLCFVCVFLLPVVVTQNVGLSDGSNCSRTDRPEPFDVWGVERDPLSCSLLKPDSCGHGNLPTHLEGPFMGSPHSLKVEGSYVTSPAGNRNPQLVYTWEPPATAAGFSHLKGFYVEIKRIAGISATKDFYCRVFDLSQNNFTTQDYKLEFRKKEVGFPGGIDFLYLMNIYTLPMAAESTPKKAFFSLQPYLVKGKGAADWSTSMSYATDNLTAPARITVLFSLAPTEYNIKKYNIELVSSLDDKNVMLHCIVNTLDDYQCQGKTFPKPPEDAMTIEHTFYDLPAAVYKVWVSPHNPDWQNEGKCLCREWTSANDSHCIRCINTSTGNITVTDIGSPPPAVAKPTDTTSPGDSSTDTTTQEPRVEETIAGPGSSSDVGIVLASVFGAMIGMFLIVVAVFLYRKKRLTGNGLISENKPTNINNLGSGKGPSVLPRKKVYLLYAEDHKDHMNVITSLAVYLKDHCHCDVFYLPWFKGAFQAVGTYQWIISHIDEADYVIVISSEAAFKLLDARNANTSLKTEDEGPEGDIFSPAITHVRTKSLEPDFYRKTILVYFDYTSEDFVLKEVSPGVQYKLPKHFRDLLCHIHEVDVFDQTRRHPEIDAMENLQSNRSGLAFQEAITKARHFQKSDPLWFDKRFRRQDSAYESDPDGQLDSISLTASPDITWRDPFIETQHLSPGAHPGSVVTCNTEYIREHEHMIPPSEVPTDTPTEIVNQQLKHINNINTSSEDNTGYEFYPQDMLPPSEIQTDVDIDECFFAINMCEHAEDGDRGQLTFQPNIPVDNDDLVSGIDV